MAAPSSVKVGLPPSAISFRRLFAPASGEHVEALDRAGKSHRGVDVALGKMKAKSPGDRRRANILHPDRHLGTGDIFRVNGYDRGVRSTGTGAHCILNWLWERTIDILREGAGKSENPSGHHVRRGGNAGLARIARKPAEAIHLSHWAPLDLPDGRRDAC